MEKFRIALAQLEPKLFAKEHNLAKAGWAIRQSAENGAQAILFPELYLTGYWLGERAGELAETLDGPSVKAVAQLAAAHHIAVVMGFAELAQDGKHAYDAVFIVDADGNIAGNYRKIHLFHAEKEWFLPGDQPFIADIGLGKTGFLVCYDLEFPEAARELALRGAQWIATSTGNMLPNQHLQEVFIQSRALENHLWVAVANRVGREAEIEFFGGSAVADPTGTLIAQADDKERLLYVDIDLRSAEQARLNADYLADCRLDLYWNRKQTNE